MPDSQPTAAPSAACAEDRERLREVGEQLAREKAVVARMEAACVESRRLIHQLNNTLSIVATFAATLVDEVDDDASRESVEEIIEATRNAAALSRRLGQLAHEAQGLAPVDHGGEDRA